jgi:hypothetical protein
VSLAEYLGPDSFWLSYNEIDGVLTDGTLTSHTSSPTPPGAGPYGCSLICPVLIFGESWVWEALTTDVWMQADP